MANEQIRKVPQTRRQRPVNGEALHDAVTWAVDRQILAHLKFLFRGAIRAGKHDRITIGVAQPALPVFRPFVSIARLGDLCLQFDDTGNGGIEVVNLKPQKQPVAIWLVAWVTDRPVVVFHSEAAQLEDQSTA